MNATVAVVGIGLLLYFAVLVGVSMDTEGQRAQWRHSADERRALAEERQRLEAVRQSVAEERRRLAEEKMRAGPCPLAQCPRRDRRKGRPGN
jgi:hypothetical protein